MVYNRRMNDVKVSVTVLAILLSAAFTSHADTGEPHRVLTKILLKEHPEMFWGVIASMYVGNVMLLLLNLPLVGLWVRLLHVPFWVLGCIVLLISVIGAYSLSNDFFNVYILLGAGIVGYVLRKDEFDAGPFVMAFILAKMVDTSLGQSLLMGEGSPAIFVTRPISAALLAAGFVYLVATVIVYRRMAKTALFKKLPVAD